MIDRDDISSPRNEIGPLFWPGSYLLMLFSQWMVHDIWSASTAHVLWRLAVIISYSAIYLAVPYLLFRVMCALRLRSGLVGLTAVFLCGLMLSLIYFDGRVYALYAMHLNNGFVINLLTTPGGLTSMGAGTETYLSTMLIVAGFIAANACLLWLSRRLASMRPQFKLSTRTIRFAGIAIIAVAGISERVAYGFAHSQGDSEVTAFADRIAFYQPLTFRHFAEQHGLAEDFANTNVQQELRLNYPTSPLHWDAQTATPNIVWLVAESWRADMLDPEIMPNTWAFAHRGLNFKHHFSGGNGTRVGLFSMFYGLHGTYWPSFLNHRQPPVLITHLQERGYELLAQTSAHFSYPEFDKTIWAGLTAKQLHEDDKGKYWQRDRHNVKRGLQWIERQAREDQPFFYFQFFESPHAPYYFPKETVIRPEYLDHLDYATMDPGRDIEWVRNRYVNAVHHLDQQLGRIFERLERTGLLNNTLVVVTGDHGEEFMEHGHWGHNSEFSNEQIRVPLLLVGPGIKPGVESAMTSHVDIAPTVLSILGVDTPARDFALGHSLLAGTHRDHVVVSSWNHVAYIDEAIKLKFGINATAYPQQDLIQADDRKLRDATKRTLLYQRYQPKMLALLHEMSAFR